MVAPAAVTVSDIPASSESPTAVPNWPSVATPAPNPDDVGVVTTNFSLFRENIVNIGTKEYQVTAGHKFAAETDTMFTIAWCYTRATAGGLVLEINLGDLNPNKAATIDMPSSAMLAKSGLSRSNVRTLFASCPWLDGNPNVQSSAGTASVYQFNAEVTENSVDRLVAAISNGATVVEFNSPGGLVGEAIRGFNAIRAASVKTVSTGDCVSACTLMYIGGSERTVAMGGRIGVHQWSTEDGVTSNFDAQMTSALLISLITSAGVSEDFYIAGARTPASSMYYLTFEELSDWGVVGRSI